MGIKDGFMGASLLVKIALIVIFVAQVCSWIAFTTSSWGSSPTSSIGLWRFCGLLTCDHVDGTNNDSMAAVQAFAIFGFVALNLGFLLMVLPMFTSLCKGNSEANLIAGISLIVSAVCWLIAVIIFGAKIDDYATNFDLDFSFGLAICALILAAVGGVLVIVSGKGGSVGSN